MDVHTWRFTSIGPRHCTGTPAHAHNLLVTAPPKSGILCVVSKRATSATNVMLFVVLREIECERERERERDPWTSTSIFLQSTSLYCSDAMLADPVSCDPHAGL